MPEWFFNNPAYLDLEARRLGGTPEVMYEHRGFCAGFVSRYIPGTRYRDGVSVYGGPSIAFGGMSIEQGKVAMSTAITNMIAERRLVSLFLRGGVGDRLSKVDQVTCRVDDIADSVVVPLTGNADEVFRGFRKKQRNQLRNGEQFVVSECDDLHGFHRVYTESMVRQAASSEYFFSLEYIQELYAIPGVRLFSIRDGDALLCSAFVVEQFPYLVYHLSGTATHALRRSPMRSLLAHVAMTHAGKGWQGFSLGGGVGGRDDTLYRFKLGFSKSTMPVQCFKAVLDPQAYVVLGGLNSEAEISLEGFFPIYRNPEPLRKRVSR